MASFDDMVSQIVKKPGPPHTGGEGEVKKAVAAGSEQNRVQKVNNTFVSSTKVIETKEELQECVQECIMQYDAQKLKQATTCRELLKKARVFVQKQNLEYRKEFDHDFKEVKANIRKEYADELAKQKKILKIPDDECNIELFFGCSTDCPPNMIVRALDVDTTYVSFDGKLTPKSRTITSQCTGPITPEVPTVTFEEYEDRRRPRPFEGPQSGQYGEGMEEDDVVSTMRYDAPRRYR